MNDADDAPSLTLAELEAAARDDPTSLRAADLGPTLVALVARHRELAAALLFARMERLCRRYCDDAAWMPGFEHTLWRAVLEGPEKMSEAEAAELDRLSDEAAGWWHWPDGAAEAAFLPIDAWREVYAQGPRVGADLASQNAALRSRIEDLERQLQREGP